MNIGCSDRRRAMCTSMCSRSGHPRRCGISRFADWLRHNDADRGVYEAAMRELAQRVWPTKQDYADAKTDVIEAILARATG